MQHSSLPTDKRGNVRELEGRVADGSINLKMMQTLIFFSQLFWRIKKLISWRCHALEEEEYEPFCAHQEKKRGRLFLNLIFYY